jgi:GNAT superfamily N-acetyltransferase
MSNTLSPGYELRPACWDDAPAVLDLMDLVSVTLGDPAGSGLTVDELLTEWRLPGFNLVEDTWVVVAPDGTLAGYEEILNRGQFAALSGDGYVHPLHTGRGIGTTMLRAMERRARELMAKAAPDLRVYIRNGMELKDEAGCILHEEEGYRRVRYFWQMEIELYGAPQEPVWPEGIRLLPLRVGQDEYAMYELMEEAFRDHWGHVPRSFDVWRHRTIDAPGYDPSLWFIAWDGDQVAGGVMNRYRGQKGWVGTLGVRRPWRKQGLGLALLLHSFGEFHRRGFSRVGLGVDAANLTGATRLYEKAGMHVVQEYVLYEKELRPGREIEEET